MAEVSGECADVTKSSGNDHLTAAWGAETAALICWFLTTNPPTEWFELIPVVTIANPGQWWPPKAVDFKTGPFPRARGRTGASRRL